MKTFLSSLFTIFAFNLFAQNPEHSIEMNGSQGYIEFEENKTSIDSSFALMGYFKSTSSNATQNFIIAKGTNGVTGNWNYNISFKDGSLSFGIAVAYVKTPENTIVQDVWHHFVCQKNNNMIYIYVDGICYDSSDVGNRVTPSDQTITKIGSTFWGGNYYLNGNIDYISIWNRALNTEEIKKYRTCYPRANETGIVTYFNFEEGSGTKIRSLVDDTLWADFHYSVNWSDSVPKYDCCSQKKISPYVYDTIEHKSNRDLILKVNDSISFKTYQWQQKIDNKFVNLSDTGRLSGTNTRELKLINLKIEDDSSVFRCVTSNYYDCLDTSNEVVVNVVVNSIENYSKTVTFYPNPIDGNLIFLKNESGKQYFFELVNLEGQVITKGIMNKSITAVSIDNEDKIILLLIRTTEGSIVSKNKIIRK